MKWGAHEVDGRLSAKNATKIRAALQEAANWKRIFEAYQRTQPAVSKNPAQDRARARAWAMLNVQFDNEALLATLRRVWADGFALGIVSADEAVQRARELKKADDPDYVDWKNWRPGDAAAALLLKPTKAFQRLLETAGVTIRGIDQTGYERIGTALSDAISVGLSGDRAAKLIRDTVADPARALTIAITETNRAISRATVERYQNYGLEQMEWATSSPCDKCAQNSGQVVRIGSSFNSGATQPPQHPNCRCALLPVIPDDEQMVGGAGVVDVMPPYQAPSSLIYPQRRLDELQEESAKLSEEMRQLGYKPYGSTADYSPEALRLRERIDALDSEWQTTRKEWYDAHFTVNGKGTGTDPYMVSDNPARDTYVVYDKATLSMNKSLRQGKPPSERALKIDEMVAEGKAIADTVVYRSAVLPEKLHSVFTEGFEYVDKGFQSTAVNRTGGAGAEFYAKARLESGAKGDVIIMSIKIPEGATARDVGVGEIVLPRNTKMRVKSRTKSADGIIEIEMEVVP